MGAGSGWYRTKVRLKIGNSKENGMIVRSGWSLLYNFDSDTVSLRLPCWLFAGILFALSNIICDQQAA